MHPHTSEIPLFSHFHALIYFLVILLKAHRTVADLLACYAQLQRLCLVVLDKCIGNRHATQLVRGLLKGGELQRQGAVLLLKLIHGDSLFNDAHLCHLIKQFLCIQLIAVNAIHILF